MGTPSISATPQARYERTTISPTTAEAVINTTRQNIGNHAIMGAGVSLNLGTPGKKVEMVDTAYLYPQNPTDTYIQASEDSLNQFTVKSDKTAKYSLYTANVQTSDFAVNGVNISSANYSAVVAYTYYEPSQMINTEKPSLTEESASFSLTRGGESCAVAVSMTTKDPNPTTGNVAENCSFLDGAQALALAQQIAQQLK